jgi:hypothetical protein
MSNMVANADSMATQFTAILAKLQQALATAHGELHRLTKTTKRDISLHVIRQG